MSSNESLIDSATFGIMAELHNSEGKRYVELKHKLGIADSTLTKRLNILKSFRLVTIEAISDEGHNYIVYKLTETGNKLVKEWNVQQVLERDKELTLA